MRRADQWWFTTSSEAEEARRSHSR